MNLFCSILMASWHIVIVTMVSGGVLSAQPPWWRHTQTWRTCPFSWPRGVHCPGTTEGCRHDAWRCWRFGGYWKLALWQSGLQQAEERTLINCLIKIVNLLLIHCTRTWTEILWILNLWCNKTSGMDDYRIRMTLYTCICKSWVKLSNLGGSWTGSIVINGMKVCYFVGGFSDGAGSTTESIHWFLSITVY